MIESCICMQTHHLCAHCSQLFDNFLSQHLRGLIIFLEEFYDIIFKKKKKNSTCSFLIVKYSGEKKKIASLA